MGNLIKMLGMLVGILETSQPFPKEVNEHHVNKKGVLKR